MHAIAVALLWTTAWTSAHAVQVEVVGLFGGKAIVVIDGGRPRTLAAGEAAGAVRLISATSESGVFEIEGKRTTLTVGSQSFGGNFKPSRRPSVVLSADHGGHYLTSGSINGAPVRFLVDTGATMVSLGAGDARRIGIDYRKGERGISNTANGSAVVYRVRLDTVKVGDITLNGIEGLVHESADMPFALLGMSFLNRMDMKHDGSQLTLTLRY